MKIRAISSLSLGLVLVLSGTLWGQSSKPYKDAIFVKQSGEEGVYSEKTGAITDLTSSEILIETGRGQLLYTREAVKRVVLDKTRKKEYERLERSVESDENRIKDYKKLERKGALDEKKINEFIKLEERIESDKIKKNDYEKLKNTVDIHWNNKKSWIVNAVLQTPVLKEAFPNGLPPALENFLAALFLLAILSYGVYRLYQMLVVATNLRKLNRTKINMELGKLHYEVESLKRELGITEEVVPHRVQIREEAVAPGKTQKIDLESILSGFKLPEVHPFEFLKYKVFRMLTKEEQQRRTDLWKKKWPVNKKSRALLYYVLLPINLVFTALAVIFSIAFFVDIILPFVDPEFLEGVGLSFSLVFILLFIVSLVFLLRLNAQRRIMRKTYLEASMSQD
jgi:hypothetical protein